MVKLWLSVIKPIDSHWLRKLQDVKKNTKSEWRAAGFQDAMKLELRNLLKIDPFSDIGAMLDDTRSEGQSPDVVCDLPRDGIVVGYSRKGNQNENDSEKKRESNCGVFDAFQEMYYEY